MDSQKSHSSRSKFTYLIGFLIKVTFNLLLMQTPNVPHITLLFLRCNAQFPAIN